MVGRAVFFGNFIRTFKTYKHYGYESESPWRCMGR